MTSIEFIISLIVFFLPYTDSLVFHVGFPLKVYEILSIPLFFFVCLRFYRIKKFDINISILEKNIYLILLIFFVWYALTGIMGVWHLKKMVLPTWAIGRFAPTSSVFFKILYFMLNLFIFFSVTSCIRSKDSFLRIVRVWIFSSFTISLYAIYLFFGSLYRWHLFFLPGTKEMQYLQVSWLGTFIRNATFKEGNIFGGYMLASLAMILPLFFVEDHERKPFSLFFVYFIFFIHIFALFISYSTIAILALFFIFMLFFIATHKQNFRIYSKKFYTKMLSLLAIILLVFFIFGDQHLIYQKLVGKDPFWSFSRKDRTNMALTAVRIADKNLLFGIGATNYGFYYNDFSEFGMKDSINKRIPGNIYVEILCESGIVGLSLFLCSIISIIMFFLIKKVGLDENLRHIPNGLFCGFLGMLFIFLAFPTFTLTFYWVLLGFLISSLKVLSNPQSRLETETVRL